MLLICAPQVIWADPPPNFILPLPSCLVSRNVDFKLGDAAEELLIEVLDICHAKSYIYRSAPVAIETSVLRQPRNTAVNGLQAEEPIIPMLPFSQ